MLALWDMEKSLEEKISVKITVDDFKSFQSEYLLLSQWLTNVVSAFSIFDPKKTPKLDSSEYSTVIMVKIP